MHKTCRILIFETRTFPDFHISDTSQNGVTKWYGHKCQPSQIASHHKVPTITNFQPSQVTKPSQISNQQKLPTSRNYQSSESANQHCKPLQSIAKLPTITNLLTIIHHHKLVNYHKLLTVCHSTLFMVLLHIILIW